MFYYFPSNSLFVFVYWTNWIYSLAMVMLFWYCSFKTLWVYTLDFTRCGVCCRYLNTLCINDFCLSFFLRKITKEKDFFKCNLGGYNNKRYSHWTAFVQTRHQYQTYCWISIMNANKIKQNFFLVAFSQTQKQHLKIRVSLYKTYLNIHNLQRTRPKWILNLSQPM